MKQLNESEINTANKTYPYSLILAIYSGNMSEYVFPSLEINWEEKRIILESHEMFFKIEVDEKYSTLYLLVPDYLQQFYHSKEKIMKSLKKLNIHDSYMWFNEWEYLPKEAQNLTKEVSQWVNEEYSMEEIEHKTYEATHYSEEEIKNLLTSHYKLAGTLFLKEYYQLE